MKTVVLVTGMALLAAPLTSMAQDLRHDPFRKAFDLPMSVRGAKIKNGELALKAVLYDTHRPIANISGQIVTLGEQVGDYHVIAVSRNSATLLRNGREKVLFLSTAEQELSAQR